MLNKVKASEPVRLYLYSLLAPVLGFLLLKGHLSSDEVSTYLALGVAVLGVPAVEKARSVVDSPATATAKQEALEAEALINSDEYAPRH